MRRKRLPFVLVSTGLAIFAVLFALEGAAEAKGHSLDPTDPMNYNTYALQNDSATSLYVHRCADSRCDALDEHVDWVEVEPGASDREQVYWGSSTPSVYAVSTTATPASTTGVSGRLCLVLNAAKKASKVVDAPLSYAVSCGD